MSEETVLIVGLGNPGRQYEHTRHNAGFDVVDILSQRWKAPLARRKHQALYAETRYAGKRVVLAQPQTYMNESGRSVLDLVQWYKIPSERLLIVYDDVDLPLGRLRVRADGSAGTHNGMRSVIYQLNRDDFPRLRVGIGRPPEGWELADYVLSGYRGEERETIYDAYLRAAACVETWLEKGLQAAQQLSQANAQTQAKPAQRAQDNTTNA